MKKGKYEMQTGEIQTLHANTLLACQMILNYLQSQRGKYKILHFRIIEQQNTMLTLGEVKIWAKKTQK